jgi:hypothetical protein
LPSGRGPEQGTYARALHLARGGVVITVNFDRGIEVAYDLITGRIDLPPGMVPCYGSNLDCWRARAEGVPALRTVAAREQFGQWLADGSPPALLKIHGSLAATGRRLVDVVVEDTEELGGLSEERRAAVENLSRASRLLITGYGGLDPDVYAPLLRAASATDSRWASRWVAEDSPIRADCEELRVELVVGEPHGLAVHALRALLSEDKLRWPGEELNGPTWSTRLDAWTEKLTNRHSGARFAHAWAWLLADVGDRDAAARLMRRVLSDCPYTAAQVRLGDILYDRAGSGDRRDALRLYRALALTRALDWPTRAHCLLRLGGIARGRAVRGAGWTTLLYLLAALFAPLLVLVEQRRRGPDAELETTAAAHGVLGQTVLRASEQAALRWPRCLWPILSVSLIWASARCEQCARLTMNGNRKALTTSHSLLALTLAAYLRGQSPTTEWQDQLKSLADSYRRAGDLVGAGNCTAALAVLAIANGHSDEAERLLGTARDLYTEKRPDRSPIASGEALIDRLECLFKR